MRLVDAMPPGPAVARYIEFNPRPVIDTATLRLR
jgi:hypothetical protein